MPIQDFQKHLVVRDYINYLMISAFLDGKEMTLTELQAWLERDAKLLEDGAKIPLSLLSVKMKALTTGSVPYLVSDSRKYKLNPQLNEDLKANLDIKEEIIKVADYLNKVATLLKRCCEEGKK